MGSTSSTLDPASKLTKNAQEVVKLMYPLYYTTINISKDEHALASAAWESILNDKSEEFLRMKGTPDFPYSSCVIFFYDTFYTRLFNVHPMSRNLFKNGMRSQGKFLVKMITLALSEINDSTGKFDKTLIKLAEVHNERGVKAVEYGVVGEVLFWVLKKVLGPNAYDSRLHMAWVKVFSRMLRVIVPCAVVLELESNSEWQSKRLSVASESYMFSLSESNANSSDAGNNDNLESEKLRKAAPTH